MSPIELVAAALGLANVFLIVRRSVWNYPFALGMVALYAVIFWDAKLYSDAGLQVFFFAVNVYGWWAWTRSKSGAGTILVERMKPAHRALWMGGALAAIWGWGSFMAAQTDASAPYWDASIAMLSVAGQILMTQRFIENWHYWIVVNVISVPLYWSKGLYLTAGLYVIFLALAVAGLIEWRKAEARQV
jgi:nicotinamide mononucleotide transporter